VKLADVMGASGLSIYAIVALLLFVIAFLAIVARTYAPGSTARYDADARIPFSDDEPGPAARARE
jgi:cbb3-type cytochrome oxidase subunit 3